MRKYKRAIARHQMKREGVEHVNRQITGTSKSGIPFKLNWREYFAVSCRKRKKA